MCTDLLLNMEQSMATVSNDQSCFVSTSAKQYVHYYFSPYRCIFVSLALPLEQDHLIVYFHCHYIQSCLPLKYTPRSVWAQKFRFTVPWLHLLTKVGSSRASWECSHFYHPSYLLCKFNFILYFTQLCTLGCLVLWHYNLFHRTTIKKTTTHFSISRINRGLSFFWHLNHRSIHQELGIEETQKTTQSHWVVSSDTVCAIFNILCSVSILPTVRYISFRERSWLTATLRWNKIKKT